MAIAPPQPREPSDTQLSRRMQWILLALVVLAIALLRMRLLGVPLERDEGDYAYGAQLLLQGLLPYRDFHTMRMPGIYAVYALPLALLGHSPQSIHLALLLVNSATIVLVFLTGRKLLGPLAGLLAAGFYGALSLGNFPLGLFANSEHFVVFLAMGGITLLVHSAGRSAALRLLSSGILLGSSVVVKQHGVFFVVFGAIYLLAAQPRIDPKRAAARLAIYALGAAVPFALVCLVIALLGLWEPFWFWTIEYAGSYSSMVPARVGLDRLSSLAPRVVLGAASIWGLALVGAASPLWDRSARPHGWLLVALAALSAAAVSVGLYFRAHYFILLFPAVALLAGMAAQSLGRGAARRSTRRAVPAFIGVVAVAYVLVYEQPILFRATPTEVSRIRYGANPFPESLEIGNFLAGRTTPRDRLLVLGSEPQIYFYAERISVTPHMHMYPLMEEHPFADELQKQLIRDVEVGRPEFIVVTFVSMSWLTRPGSSKRLFDWMYDYIPRHYQRVGLVEIDPAGGSRSYWDDEARGREASSEYFLLVFQRIAGPDLARATH